MNFTVQFSSADLWWIFAIYLIGSFFKGFAEGLVLSLRKKQEEADHG